jgi:hypothetical protein
VNQRPATRGGATVTAQGCSVPLCKKAKLNVKIGSISIPNVLVLCYTARYIEFYDFDIKYNFE